MTTIRLKARFEWLPALLIVAFLMAAFTCVPLALGAEQNEDPEASSGYEIEFPSLVVSEFANLSDPADAVDVQGSFSSDSDGQSSDSGDSGTDDQSGESADPEPSDSSESVTPEPKRNGKAKYSWPNGDSYNGNWVNDVMRGTGTYRFSSGGKLAGKFKANKFYSGSYTLKTKKGTFRLYVKKGAAYKANIKTKKGFTYKGAFKNGKLNGKGTAKYPSGGKYKGAFKKGKRSGVGTYTWESGAKYKGRWKNDKMNGKGTYFYKEKAKAKKLVGKFSKNKPTGWCKYTLRTGKTYKTYWKNGKCTKVK